MKSIAHWNAIWEFRRKMLFPTSSIICSNSAAAKKVRPVIASICSEIFFMSKARFGNCNRIRKPACERSFWRSAFILNRCVLASFRSIFCRGSTNWSSVSVTRPYPSLFCAGFFATLKTAVCTLRLKTPCMNGSIAEMQTPSLKAWLSTIAC